VSAHRVARRRAVAQAPRRRGVGHRSQRVRQRAGPRTVAFKHLLPPSTRELPRPSPQLEVAVMTLLDLVDHIAAEVAAATAGYAVADALPLAAAADAATTNVKTADDFAAAAYATADADLALIVAQYAVADACWRSRP